MRFFKVYLELTNRCGLGCDFCPPKEQTPKLMDFKLFRSLNAQLSGKTKRLCYHLMGDPLTISHLSDYLDISAQFGHRVELVTSGFYMSDANRAVLSHKTVAQVNFSLSSYQSNSQKLGLEKYLEPILDFCDAKDLDDKKFVNLRLWTLGVDGNEVQSEILRLISEHFGIPAISVPQTPSSIRVAKKVFVHFERRFSWPSLDAAFVGERGFCHGGSGQIAVLADGRVVPCCLDHTGVITLGDANSESLQNIVQNERSRRLICGFEKREAEEPLCRHCEYRLRFDT